MESYIKHTRVFLFLLFGLNTTIVTADETAVQLKGQRYRVEIADNPATRAQGLMFRKSLPTDHGMLFIFPSAEKQAFWMKNTFISLDILFFDSERRLINVHHRVPPCKTEPCPIYASHAPAQYTLELNAGSAEKLGVKPGDELTIHR